MDRPGTGLGDPTTSDRDARAVRAPIGYHHVIASLRHQSIAVVGAGAAGLSAAKHLLAAGCDVTVFDAGSRPGGLWVYENDSGRSPAYASLHINSEAAATHYADFPFPAGTPIFPSHAQIADYLARYADHFAVAPHIRASATVTAVEPVGPQERDGWDVTTQDGSTARFDAVVVAAGHQSTPAHPGFAADFAGEYLHSHAYRVPEPFRGKRVLVVGVGNSALDIAADVCLVTEQTFVAVRSPVLIMPRMLAGVPTSRVLAGIGAHRLPWPLQRRVRELVTWIVHGRMERHGLRRPKRQTHPSTHPTFMTHVAYERIHIRPGVTAVTGHTVRFDDGREETVDTIIAATGYELDLPFLPAAVDPVDGRRMDVYKRVLHPDWPGLWFAGYFNVSGGANIRMMDVQSRWLAALASGAVEPPSREAMLASIAAERRELARRYPDAPRYGLELDPLEYPAAVERELA